jgi:hypothetical protein
MPDSEKMTATLNKETIEWLRETYPDAMSDQEAVRMAISDARGLREWQSRGFERSDER